MYRVEWLPSEEKDLAKLWNDSKARDKVAAAADAIDDALARNPKDFGESREGKTRIAFMKPLALRFSIDEEASLVRLWDIWSWAAS